jgi:hypothetical protein
MLKRFAAVAICVMAIWAISLERTYAWLGLQSAGSERWLCAGMHPLSFDFTASKHGDARWLLIGQDGFGASTSSKPDGLHVQPLQSSFDMRLNLAGARLSPKQVNAVTLDVRTKAGRAPPKFSLVVHAGLDDAGWIAELGGDLSQSIDLHALEFKREPTRSDVAHWADLPPLTHLRLYGSDAGRSPFVLATVAFKSNQKLASTALYGSRPEALLKAFDAARSGPKFATTSYRGPWLAPIAQIWISVACLIFAFVLLVFEFASEVPKYRARARALLVPALFLPIITMLWGNVNWPVDSRAAFAPQWFALAFGLLFAIVYRWINKPPRIARLNFDAGTKAAWISCALPTSAVALVILLGFAALPARVGFEPQHFGLVLALKYLAFAAFQQWLLQTLVWTNLRRAALARSTAVLLSALLFALLHTPNFVLMLLCFLGALFWCGHYAKYRRLLPLILSHAFLGFLCVSVIPTNLLRSADIGVVFFLK